MKKNQKLISYPLFFFFFDRLNNTTSCSWVNKGPATQAVEKRPREQAGLRFDTHSTDKHDIQHFGSHCETKSVACLLRIGAASVLMHFAEYLQWLHSVVHEAYSEPCLCKEDLISTELRRSASSCGRHKNSLQMCVCLDMLVKFWWNFNWRRQALDNMTVL